jgi:hypothetical protein
MTPTKRILGFVGLAACVGVGWFTISSRSKGDLLSPLQPHAIAERTFYVNSSTWASTVAYRDLYVKSLSKDQIVRLLQPRVGRAGFVSEDPEGHKAPMGTWWKVDNDVSETIIVADAKDVGLTSGYVVVLMYPPSKSELFLARLLHLGRDPRFSDSTMPFGKTLFD